MEQLYCGTETRPHHLDIVDYVQRRIALANEASRRIVFVAIGTPGSGKSTAIEKVMKLVNRPDEGDVRIAHINPGQIREKMQLNRAAGDSSYDPSKYDSSINDQVWVGAYAGVQLMLAQDKHVFINATHSDPKRRPHQVAKYRADHEDVDVVGLVFEVNPNYAIERNLQRAEEGGRSVPNDYIRKNANRIVDSPPSIEEGFDEVVWVRDLGTGQQ